VIGDTASPAGQRERHRSNSQAAAAVPPGRVTVVPVVRTSRRGGTRPVGAYVVADDTARWRPAVDLTRLLLAAELLAGGVMVAHRLRRRAGSPAARISMGPGGWVSMRGGDAEISNGRARAGGLRAVGLPARWSRPAGRPWWAGLLRARPLDPAGPSRRR
jgi:hypothetical protein